MITFFKKTFIFSVFFAVLVSLPLNTDAALDGSNILLTEVMPDAVQTGVDNEFEWAELYNPTNAAIDINGWEIIDGAGNNYIFDNATDSTMVGPGEYRLLVLDATDSPANGKTDTNSKSFEIGYPGLLVGLPTGSEYIDLVEAIKLNNTGDSLELCTDVCNGTNQVDYVEWEDFSNSGLWNDDAGSGTGNSICRDGIIDTDTDADWSVTACNTDVTDTANDGNPGTGTYGTYDVTITASGVDTVVGESGPTSDTYTIVLESTPSATETVTIAIATDAQCSTDVTTVMFDTTNWNTPQTVTITAVDDALIETSPHTCAVTHTATSSNTTSRYHLLATDDINVDVVDNDSSIIATIPTSSKKKKASIKYTCKDESAQNYGRFGRHKQSLCIYAENSSPSVVTLDDLAENAQCPYFTQYHRAADTQGEVRLIQMFLNQYYNEGLDIDGVYGNNTQNAVSRFQTYWKDEVLTPWGLTKSTSRWYQSTKNKANEVAGCDEGRIQLDNGVYVD